MYILKNDGSIEDQNGKVIFFSLDRFISDIVNGNCCFICGVRPAQAEFNNEHILPKWILKKYSLYNKKIALPNLTDIRYDRYTIPCCKSCNSLMNKKIEQPIYKLISKGYNEITKHIRDKGPWLFFIWLCLIYLKTHLKDKSLKYYLKDTNSRSKISDLYEWDSFHHIHCIARSFYTGVEMSANVLGSLLVLPSKVYEHYERYDYGDLYLAKTLFIRLDEITFISVLNDSCSSLTYVAEFVNKINDYVSPLQIRELMARLAYANIKLKTRPDYFSDINLIKQTYSINAKVPKTVVLDNLDAIEFGRLMYNCCKDIIAETISNSEHNDIELVKKGLYTFILDNNKNFIKNSMKFLNNT